MRILGKNINSTFANYLFRYNSKVDSSLVIEREQWWKNLLLTREFGYNKN